MPKTEDPKSNAVTDKQATALSQQKFSVPAVTQPKKRSTKTPPPSTKEPGLGVASVSVTRRPLDLVEIVPRLSAPLPKGKHRLTLVTHRLNEVCGLGGWGFTMKVVHNRSGSIKGGGMAYEITVGVQLWIGEPGIFRIGFGGSMGGVQDQVINLATSQAFINAAAMFGIGREFLEWDDSIKPPTNDFDRGTSSGPSVREIGFSGPVSGGLDGIFDVPSTELIRQAEDRVTSPQSPITPQLGSPPNREENRAMAAEDGAPPGRRAQPAPALAQDVPMTQESADLIKALGQKTNRDVSKWFTTPKTETQAKQAIQLLMTKAQEIDRMNPLGGGGL